MLDPDFIYETQQNANKLKVAKLLLEEFEQLPMPSLMQYMRFVERMKTVLTYGDKDGNN